ncbi:MAG: tetratricopeptide repeat protein [Acidobacteriales bacterium]|nr:tetratricopeptide repeat protein [Terriglobales bacterium]
MRLMRYSAPATLLLLSGLVFAQSAPQPPPGGQREPASAGNAAKAPNAKTGAQAPKKVDRAAAYYHYSLAHIYEELVSMYGRSEFASKAIEEYRLAIQNDPDSEYLNAGLAELYAKTGRIRDAVLEAQDILKRDPSNLEAHKLLGRIYLRSLGDMQTGTQSQEILKLAIEQFEHIVRIQPKSVDDHLLLGRLYRLNNELLKAENEFKTAVKLQPDSEEALTSLAYLYDEEGDSAKAIEVLNSVPDANRSARLYAALGYTYEQKKDYKKAVDAYRKAIELDRDNLDSVRGLAQNLLNDGQLDPALEQYKNIADSDPQDAQAHLRSAEIYRRLGNFDLALASLKKAEALVQDSLEVPYNIALVYEVQGRYDEAVGIIQGLLKKSEKPDGNYNSGERNNRAVFLERLGSVYREMGKPQLAIEAFRRILQLGEENAVRGYQQIIDTYREQKQWQQATSSAQEAVAKFPKDRQLKMLLASQFAENGQGDTAVSELKSLLKGGADDREIYIALAQVQTRLRHWKEAEEAVEQAEKLSPKPEDKEYVAFIRGSVYERQKKYDLAEEQFKKVLAGDPHNAMVLNYLGYMLADRGLRLDEALAYIKKAAAQDPQNGAYLDSLGWAYFKLGNYDLAEENLRKASLKISNDGTIQDHLGDLYFKTGRLKLAAAHWERALEEWGKTTLPGDVDTTDVARVQKKLESAKVRLAKQAQQQSAGKQ